MVLADWPQLPDLGHVAFVRRHARDQVVRVQELREAPEARAIEGSGRVGEARQGRAPGAAIELAVELRAALEEQFPRLVGLVHAILRAALDRIEEAAQRRIVGARAGTR
jgi:hypothetical protein